MTSRKTKSTRIPATVPRDEFTRILGNLASTPSEKRKDAPTGEKKKQATIIPPTKEREGSS